MKLLNTALVVAMVAAVVKVAYDVNTCCNKAVRSGKTEELKVFGKVIGTIKLSK